AREFTAPLTLSPTAEGTPSIVSADDSRIVLGFHYYREEIVDREAEGVLTDFTTWRAAPAPALDAEFAPFGIAGNIGDRDPFTVAQDARLRAAETLRDRAAAHVVDCGADLDAMHAPLAERVADERRDRERHRAAALCVLGEPEAQLDRAIDPVEWVESRDS